MGKKKKRDDLTLEEYLAFMRERLEEWGKMKRAQIIEHKDDWYEGAGPDEFRMDIGSWWEAFDADS